MDILERLNKNIEAAKNGPYVGVKEQRDSWQAAIEEVIYLRNTVGNLKAHIGDYENKCRRCGSVNPCECYFHDSAK